MKARFWGFVLLIFVMFHLTYTLACDVGPALNITQEQEIELLRKRITELEAALESSCPDPVPCDDD